jgi:hypothetical protein
MARIKGVTGRQSETAAAANPRSQAHPMPGWSSILPKPDGSDAAGPPMDPGLVFSMPNPPDEAVARATHTWTTDEQPYDRLDCPACGTIFRELPDAAGPCPACGATIDVLTCPEGVRHLMLAADVLTFDDDWDALHGQRRRDESQRRNVVALQARRAALASYVELGVRLVELRTAPNACATCVAAAGRPFRPRAAPALPIAGCGNDFCRCVYAPARPTAARR